MVKTKAGESCEKKPSPREKAILALHKEHPKYDYCKHEHLRRIAVWATETDVDPSLAAYYGNLLASHAESAGKHTSDDKKVINKKIDLSDLNTCKRCGIVLQPGSNCTVRIEKTKSRRRRKCKDSNISKNNVVYTCHFCSHRDLRIGTKSDHMKAVCPTKAINSVIEVPTKAINSVIEVKTLTPLLDSERTPNQLLDGESTPTPLLDSERTPIRLLDTVRRKRKAKKMKSETPYQSASKSVENKIGAGITTTTKKPFIIL